MDSRYIKKLQTILEHEYHGGQPKRTNNIVYEHGHPLTYKDDFSKLWLVHMEYISSIQTFKAPTATLEVFNESLDKFITKHNNAKLFVAKEEGKMVGFLQAGISSNKIYGLFSDLHVLEDYRQFGIGRQLIQNGLDWFTENNVEEVGLEVTGGNESALNFHIRNGFSISNYTLKMKIEKGK